MNLIEIITREMADDEDNLTKQSELLEEAYLEADEAGKALLDKAFICLCGWSLQHLIEKAESEEDNDV
jgi:hypothetical protein